MSINNQLFAGKVALVTGASQGFGAAVAIWLASQGAHVCTLARSKKGLERTDDAIRQLGGESTLILSDLRKASDIAALGPALAQRFAALDILIGNAALLGPLMPVTHMPPDIWQDIFTTNVTANMQLLRSLDPLLRTAPYGRAVFVTSSVAQAPRAFWGGYAASKAALESLVTTYAMENAHTSVKANCFNPGAMQTSMRASAFPGENPQTLPDPGAIAPLLAPLLVQDCPHNGAVMNANAR
ncbi:MAG: SDR family NAD(P)-dependent oxidoreductase [Pseudomonadota bacterium]